MGQLPLANQISLPEDEGPVRKNGPFFLSLITFSHL